MTPAQLPRQASQVISDLVDAALADRDTQSHLSHPEWGRVWTTKRGTRHPMVPLVFEQATVIGGLGFASSKTLQICI